MEYFRINGKDSRDFNCFLAKSNMLDAPPRDYSLESVPGRNGDLVIDNGRFKNFDAELTVYFRGGVVKNAADFKSWLLSENGYVRYEESTDPEIYRMVKLSQGFEMSNFDRAGGYLDMKFTCKPQKWLKRGEQTISITNGSSIRNQTRFPARPLITVTGSGTLTIGDISVTCTESMTIDCEAEECYSDSKNENGNITLDDGDFPILPEGLTEITYSGFTSVILKPRWWAV